MKPIGAEVGITYDSPPDLVIEPGHFMVTTTGRTYVVTAAHAPRPGRWVLRCVVVRPPAPADAVIHDVRWHTRTSRRKNR